MQILTYNCSRVQFILSATFSCQCAKKNLFLVQARAERPTKWTDPGVCQLMLGNRIPIFAFQGMGSHITAYNQPHLKYAPSFVTPLYWLEHWSWKIDKMWKEDKPERVHLYLVETKKFGATGHLDNGFRRLLSHWPRTRFQPRLYPAFLQYFERGQIT